MKLHTITRKHQRIAGEIFAIIYEYINANNGSCEVDIAPFAVFLRIVDLDKNRITVYDFESEDTRDYTFIDSVKSRHL